MPLIAPSWANLKDLGNYMCICGKRWGPVFVVDGTSESRNSAGDF